MKNTEEIKSRASSVRKMAEALLEQIGRLEGFLVDEAEPDEGVKTPSETSDVEEVEVVLEVEAPELSDISGVGGKTIDQLHSIGISTVADLAKSESKDICKRLNNSRFTQRRVQEWIDSAIKMVEEPASQKPEDDDEFDPEVDCKEADENGLASFGNPDEFGIYNECVDCSIRKECETATKKGKKGQKESSDGKGYLVTSTDISHLPKGAREFVKAIGKASWRKAPSPLNWSDILEAMPTMESGVVPDYLGRCQISGCNKEAKMMMFETKTHLHGFLCGYHFKEAGELFYADEKPPQYE